MKALTSPSCRVCLERGPSSFSSSCSSAFVRISFEKCFLQSRKVSGFGFLNSVLVKQSEAIIYPVSCVSSKTQVDFGIENAETEERYKSSTVHVKFLLLKECVFGEQFLIVGDDPMFGLWDPESAVPLNWSEGHLWTVELDIPVGKSIQFKFILKDASGEIVWQPGADRVFQTWETKNTITVSEDWENTELQIVSEEEQAAIQQEDSPVKSELTVVSRQEELVVEENIESAISNKDSSQGEQPLEEPIKGQLVADNISPLQEKPKSSVANDISDTKIDPRVSYNPQVPNEKRVDSGNENFNVISNNNVTIADEILGNNGTVETAKNLASTNLVDCEGEPVLVPGLTPPTSVPTEEENHDQVDKKSSVDESTEAVEAKDHNLPEVTA